MNRFDCQFRCSNLHMVSKGVQFIRGMLSGPVRLLMRALDRQSGLRSVGQTA